MRKERISGAILILLSGVLLLMAAYDRYIKTAAQGITKASKAFMLDAVIDEDAERLTKDMEENPGIAISIGNKLTEILGLTGTANLKKL